jgi:aspartate kinase
LALRANQTRVTIRSAKMFHAYGFLAKVFEILAKHKISVDLITTSEISVSITLDKTDTAAGAPELPAAARAELEELAHIEVERNLSLVALIGNHMETKGYAKKVFSTLGDYNMRMIFYAIFRLARTSSIVSRRSNELII